MSGSKWILTLFIAGGSVSALAAPEHFTLDPEHTYPSLEVPHMGISVFRGKFLRTSGKVTLDRAAQTGSVEVKIDAASVDFGHDKVNEHVRSKDFLNVARYPTISYKGALKFSDGTPRSADGQLTLLGVTKPVKLTIHSFNCIEHPMLKKEYCGADAEAEFHRADFGMTYYSEGELGKVHVRIQVEALKDG